MLTAAGAEKICDVAIVGAGAAGLATAIFARRRNPQLSVWLLEGARSIGAKILVSGGGRCNVTNARVSPSDYQGGSRNIIRRVLARFDVASTIAFFREIGVSLHEEDNGKLFPDSNRARSVCDALLGEAARVGVRILLGRRVRAVSAAGSTLELELDDVAATKRERLRAAAVVLATGGLSLPKTGSDGAGYAIARHFGHSIVPTTPALAPLLLDGDFHSGLSGVSHEVEIQIRSGATRASFPGALLWTHFGISGPAPMNASGTWHRLTRAGQTPKVTARLVPLPHFEAAEQAFLQLAAESPAGRLQSILERWLPTRVAGAVCQRLAAPATTPLAQFSRAARHALLQALLAWPLPVRDSRGYGYAEVTAGGVALGEIDSRSMQSRLQPGLYLVGEILDVDGRIGGFNFQWAWSSAFVCGEALGQMHGTAAK